MPDPTSVLDQPAAPRRGVLPPRLVRGAAFAVILLAVAVGTLIALLAIWGALAQDALWRSLATVVVVMAATGLVTVVNEALAPRNER